MQFNKKFVILFFNLVFSFLGGFCFSQNFTAKFISQEAIKKENPESAIEYINESLKNVSVPAEKRSLLIFLADLQESASFFTDAKENFAKAAGIAASDANGMPKRSTEQLVIDAVRCALCAGESEQALQYLNSSVRNSKNEKIQAFIKLYEQWAILSNAQTEKDLDESISLLNAYLSMTSMESVKSSISLTLWYITGQDSYSKLLIKEFPYSTECAIVTGKVQILPAPFWFFVPRKSVGKILYENNLENPKTDSLVQNSQNNQITQTELKEETQTSKTESKNSAESSESSQIEKPVKQQTGLFKSQDNANSFVKRLKEKGFNAYIQTETRASGTTYYIVVVDENSEGTMGLQLKTAGFESYPVY